MLLLTRVRSPTTTTTTIKKTLTSTSTSTSTSPISAHQQTTIPISTTSLPASKHLLVLRQRRQQQQQNNSAFSTKTMSSEIRKIETQDAMKPAGPYSQAIATPHAIYCSGQIPALPSGELVEGTIGQKTAACCRALSAVLQAAGSSMDRVVKVNVFLTDMGHFAEMNAEYEKWFTTKPARSCVAVHQLPKGVEVEIECVALP